MNIRRIQRLILDDFEDLHGLENLWHGHLAELNPEARGDFEREQWVLIGWEVACLLAFIGFVIWLSLR